MQKRAHGWAITATTLALVAGATATAQTDRAGATRPDAQPLRKDMTRAMTPDYRFSKWLSDRPVVSSDSLEEIGTTTDLIVDRGSGRVEHAIIKTGGALGMGGKDVAIPFDELRWSAGEERFVLSSTKEALKTLPEFDASEWAAMIESREGHAGSTLFQRMTSDTVSERDPYAGSLKDAKRERVEGTVVHVERDTAGAMREQTTLAIETTDGKTRHVTLGPSWYVAGSAARPVRGDHVTLETYTIPSSERLVARQIVIGSRQLTLRDDTGAPVWTRKTLESGGKMYDTPRWRYVLASTVRGMRVDTAGQEAGAVDELIIDRVGGAVAFLSIDPNENFLGIADTKRLVPWRAASIANDGVVRLDASKEMVLASPETPKDLKTFSAGSQTEALNETYRLAPERRTEDKRGADGSDKR